MINFTVKASHIINSTCQVQLLHQLQLAACLPKLGGYINVTLRSRLAYSCRPELFHYEVHLPQFLLRCFIISLRSVLLMLKRATIQNKFTLHASEMEPPLGGFLS